MDAQTYAARHTYAYIGRERKRGTYTHSRSPDPSSDLEIGIVQDMNEIHERDTYVTHVSSFEVAVCCSGLQRVAVGCSELQ